MGGCGLQRGERADPFKEGAMGDRRVKGREKPSYFSTSLASWDGSSIHQDHQGGPASTTWPQLLGSGGFSVSHYTCRFAVAIASCYCGSLGGPLFSVMHPSSTITCITISLHCIPSV